MGSRVGFELRIAAWAIDLGILFLLNTGFALGTFALGRTDLFAGDVTSLSVIGMLPAVCTLLYYLTELFVAGTPGKKMLGLEIRDEGGGLASQSQLFWRMISKSPMLGFSLLASMVIPLIVVGPCHMKGLLGSLLFTIGIAVSVCQAIVFFGSFLMLTPNKQALHDCMTGTAVYRVGERERSLKKQEVDRLAAIVNQRHQHGTKAVNQLVFS